MNNVKANLILDQAIQLKYFDRIRFTKNSNGELEPTIRKCQTLVEAVFRSLYDLYEYIFCGGKANLDNKTFNHLWNSLESSFHELSDYLTTLPDNGRDIVLDKTKFEFLQKLLQLEGVVKATEWEESLKDNSNYNLFLSRLEGLQKMALSLLSNNPDLDLDSELKRWIRSNEEQRKFRVMTPSGKLPYLYDHIPKGAVLLTNLDAYKAFLFSKGFSLTLSQRLRQLKKYINLIFTNSKYIHAEISLGNGKVYHQDKKDSEDGHFGGKGYIENRKGKLCFHDVLQPKKTINDDDWKKVNQIISTQKEEGNNIKTSLSSMIRTVVHRKRRKNYQPPTFDSSQPNHCAALAPGKTNACSAVVAIFHAVLDIDVGAQFNKRVEDISPADLARSNQYKSYYHSGL